MVPVILNYYFDNVPLPSSGNSRDVISPIAQEELMQGVSTAPLWASCAGRLCRRRLGAIPSPSPSLEAGWWLPSAWAPHRGERGQGRQAFGAPLSCIIMLTTRNNLAVTSVVLSKKLAWFILEASVFIMCMAVKSACLSWGLRNPSAYQYHYVHSSFTKIDSNVKDSDGSEKRPCFILTLLLPVDTLTDYCT